MSAMTDYLEGQLANHIFRTASFAKPTALYIGLFTSPTDDSGGGTEVTGGSYARAQNDPGDANWDGPTSGNGQASNAVAVAFPAPTGDWGQATHFGIFDAPTGGNRLFHDALTQPKTINNGDPAPTFPPGSLVITFA